MSDKNLHQRIISVMADMGAVGKGGKTNYGDKYEYHRIDDIDAALREALVKNGVVVTIVDIMDRKLEHFQETDRRGNPRTTWYAECALSIRLVNADKPEDNTAIMGWGQGLDYSDKATGKAISYAAKAAYLSAFHLRGQPDSEDDDIRRDPPEQKPEPEPEPPMSAKKIADLVTEINDCNDLPTMEDTILRGKQYQLLRSNGPKDEYERVRNLAKAKHTVLKTPKDNHNANS